MPGTWDFLLITHVVDYSPSPSLVPTNGGGQGIPIEREIMNNEDLNEFVKYWADAYSAARQIGMKHTNARNEALSDLKQQYPELIEYLDAATSHRIETEDDNPKAKIGHTITSRIGGAAYKLRRQFDIAAATETPSMLPPPAEKSDQPVAKNGYTPTADIENYFNAIDPEVGEEVPINLEFFTIKYGKTNDAAYRYPFIGKESRLIKAGWSFEVVNNKSREYRVKVTGKPAPQPSSEEVEMKSALAALEAQMAALRASFEGKYGKK